MKKYLLLPLTALLLGTVTVKADNATPHVDQTSKNVPEWCNPQVNQQNREPRRANFFAFESE